jgi:uncharacterized membrane protein
MQKEISRLARFLRSTATGGLIFLLPLAVLLALLGQVYSIVIAIAQPLHAWIPVYTPLGISVLFLAALAILVLLCFLAGLAAQRAVGKRFSSTIEKQLITVFPKYAIYKDLLAGNLKHESFGPSLTPVVVETIDGYSIAFEADRLANGLVVVYFPGAPDTWNGTVMLIAPSKVSAIELEFGKALGIFERLGRESAAEVAFAIPACAAPPDDE